MRARRLILLVLCQAVAAVAQPTADELLLDIDAAVRLGLERNRDLQLAAEGLTEAREQVSEAWGQVYPQVRASASYARNISPAVSFVPARVFDPTAPEGEFISLQFGADNSWQSALSVEQALFDPAVLVGLGAAERYEAWQTEVVRGQAQQVATRVRALCYALLLAREEVLLTERSLARVQQSLDETEARSRAGMATSYDELRLRVELANLESALLRARNQVASTRRELAVELDIEKPERLRLATERALSDTTGLPDVSSLPDSTEVLVEQALLRRSDVRQQQLMVALRKTQVRLQKADYLPTVSLFGTWDVQAQQNGSPDFFGDENSRATSKVAGVRVELPLFTGLQRDARIDQSQAVRRQAETSLRLTQDRAATEVRNLVADITEAAAREKAQRLAMEQADTGYRITLARYQRGVGSRLEMTDAEVALRQSEYNHAQAAHDLLTTRARLDHAVGRVAPVDAPEAP